MYKFKKEDIIFLFFMFILNEYIMLKDIIEVIKEASKR